MGVWETDDEYLSGPAATSLPTPLDTPYRTPSRASKRSRRSVTPPGKDSSIAQLPNETGSKRSSRNIPTDETISILDPRRFTPTLHANLVSEILSLRRDQEEKTRQIETLEASLHAAKEEKESVKQNLTETSKESRSLKRQLSLLEGGSSSALGELSRERDEAVDSVADARKRLEAAQKKIRVQEEDSQRVHELWAQEKDSWEDERRKFERRIHVAESRLKTVLDEFAAYQQAQINNAHGGANHGTGNGHDSEVEESGRENDAASVRTMSMTNSIRFSMTSGTGIMRLNGNSLADELNFDDEDEQSDFDGRESAMSNYATSFHTRNLSRDSPVKRFHARNQSLESIKRTGSVTRGRLFMNQSVPEALEDEEDEGKTVSAPVSVPKVSYTDTGIQYSPPPSPKLHPAKPATPEPRAPVKLPEVECSPRGDGEIEANQRRKRVHPPINIEPAVTRRLMVSSSVQTTEEPLLPPSPKTPKSPTRPPPPPPVQPPVIDKPLMVTSSTQTEGPPIRPPPAIPPALPSLPPLAIPSISVHPPTSRPTTPKEPRLPVLFKDFSCQVALPSSSSTSEAAVQTEGIQTDKRMALLPPHLQPSAISSRPTSPNPTSGVEPTKSFTPIPGNVPPRNPRRLNRQSFSDQPSSPISLPEDDTLHDAYPGNNDDGPLSSQKAPVRRPHRFSSLFAGFDGGSSDEADDFGDVDLSDLEYRTALSAPRPRSISSRPGKRSSTGTTETYGTIPTSPEQITMRQGPRVTTEIHHAFTTKPGRGFEKGPAAMPSNRASVMRKAAMIQNGIASHQGQGRARSPSLPDNKNPPPFPIPTRASSRNVPPSASAPSDGQRSPTRGDFFQRRGSGRVYRAGSVRKVRSAAALPRNHRHRKQGSRSSPPLSPSTEAPESPGLPPLPKNDITTPRTRARHSGQFRHQHKLSTNTDNTFNTYNSFNTYNTGNTLNTSSTDPPSNPSNPQNTSVVDAIAQTMVGEWMFKYVRRRKSFGVAESNGKDDTGNDRHKRWVWLAPYERAILWSSKQPSSGSALMGKAGRKLTIQSVLDVKDDNTPPKGVATVFNRSILILTPQRALKFTADSADRHYIWLTALSFLAHSSQAVPENISAPPPIQQTPLPDFEAPRPKLKRGGIRDSIRLAKGRTVGPRAGPPSVPSIPSIPSAPSSQLGDVTSFPAMESVGGFSSTHSREDSRDAAEPPFIPRFHDRNQGNQVNVHGRKRSNTGGHVPPPLSFRGFSGPIGGVGHHQSTNSTAGNSTGTAGSSDIYQSQASSNGTWAMSQAGSQRTSEASSRPSNFFDAIGTVRMEAFISPLAFSQFNDYPDEQDEFRHSLRRRSKEQRRRQSRSRHRDSYNSRSTRATHDDYYHGSRTAGEEDYFRDDPFKGF